MITHGIASSHATEFTWLSRQILYTVPHPESIRRRSDEPKACRDVRRKALRHPTYGWEGSMRSSAERHGSSTGSVSIAMPPEGLTLTPHLPRPRLPPTGAVTAHLPNVQGNTEITSTWRPPTGVCAS